MGEVKKCKKYDHSACINEATDKHVLSGRKKWYARYVL